MPKVTSIEPQKRREEFFNIFLDGRFAFSLSAIDLTKAGLGVDQELSIEKVNSFIKESDFSLNFDRVLKFLSFRPRSEFEINEYLLKKGVGEETRKMVLEKLVQFKLLDDEAFAKWWLDQRSGSRPKGSRLVKFELQRKGIKKEIVDSLMAENRSPTTDAFLAEKVAKKRLERLKNLPTLEIKKKLFSSLAQKGFSYEVIEETIAKLVKKG